jgi:hypothetical protein
MDRQGFGAMRKGIKIFKPEIINNIKKGDPYRNTGNSMNIKSYSAKSLPGGFVKFIGYRVSIIGKCSHNGTYKG